MPNVEEKMKTGREYRRIEVQRIQIRKMDDGSENYEVEGYACTFGRVYRLYNGTYYKVDEQIDQQAFASCDMSDVICQFDHMGRVFARTSNKTLELSIDSHGLKCLIRLGGTEEGRKLYEEIKGGYITKMSFGFAVEEDKREETYNKETGITTVLRTITKIKKLYDVSAVSLPANDATEISARNYCDGVIAGLEEERRKKLDDEYTVNLLKLYLEVNK